MKHTPMILSVLALMLCQFPIISVSAEGAEELDKIRFNFEVALADLEQNEPLQELNKKYRGYLAKQKAAYQKEGNLDGMLAIGEELKGLEDDPKEALLSFPELKRLQGIYREQREKLVGVLNEKKLALFQSYEKKAEKLSVQLTREGKIEEAKLALAESGRITAMKSVLPSKKKTIPPPAAESTSALPTGANSPTFNAIAAIPVAERPRCRIVFLPINSPAGTTVPSTFEAVAEADFTDIIGIGRAVYPNVGAIRGDGSLVYWTTEADSPHISPGSNIWCGTSYLLPFIGLDRDGSVNTAGQGSDPSLIGELQRLSNVSVVGVTSGVAVTVDRTSGKATVFGRRDHSNAAKLESLEGIRDLRFAGFAFIDALLDDNRIIAFVNGKMSTKDLSGKWVRLHEGAIVEDRRGKLISYGREPQWILDEVKDEPLDAFSVSGYFVASEREGRLHFWEQSKNGDWDRRKDLEKALHGTFQFAWLASGEHSWLAAILPAESVPRSGVWMADELAKARGK